MHTPKAGIENPPAQRGQGSNVKDMHIKGDRSLLNLNQVLQPKDQLVFQRNQEPGL